MQEDKLFIYEIHLKKLKILEKRVAFWREVYYNSSCVEEQNKITQ